MRRALLVTACALAATPAAASADGLPVGNVDVGEKGVTVPGAPHRIVALEGAAGSTVVARIAREGGQVERSLVLPERLTVPGVALDGTADGLSADGRTAVLIRPRGFGHYPLRRTRLVVLGVRPLKVRRRIALRGDFSFDALSPDGRRLFLVNYVDPRDPRAYVVRTYDVRRGRLERGAIVDAREPDEDMRGFPMTRLTTSDGRWAYTLYDGGGEPFVHALDTVERRAFCIDLPMLAGEEPSTLKLRLDAGGGEVSVLEGDAVLARIDTQSMTASEPPPARPPAPPAEPTREEGDGFDWWLAGVIGAFVFVALAGARRVRRGRARAA